MNEDDKVDDLIFELIYAVRNDERHSDRVVYAKDIGRLHNEIIDAFRDQRQRAFDLGYQAAGGEIYKLQSAKP